MSNTIDQSIIRLVKNLTDSELRELNRLIEREHESRVQKKYYSGQCSELNEEEISLLKMGNTIQAIHAYKKRNKDKSCSYFEAKLVINKFIQVT